MMELLAPAGNLEKLRIAYRYGADAAYIGIHGFSLRSAADTIGLAEAEEQATLADQLASLKQITGQPKKLYAALNLFAHQRDFETLPEVLASVAALPLDALIVADIGLIEPIRRVMPEIELHLSTQANCTNAAAARLYGRLGFRRIVAARELTIDEVKEIKDAVPEIEIETFVHGAMCMSYSGRCFLSSAMTGRSANRGDCAHSCRWRYALVEEKRPGEYYPITEDGGYSTILSSRDLMLFDHIDDLSRAGVTAVKIEGRMKSALYTAITTGAYRAAIDATRSTEHRGTDTTSAPDEPLLDHWRSLLFTVPHRTYTAGFLFNDLLVHVPADAPEPASYRLMGILRERIDTGRWTVDIKNAIYRGSELFVIDATGVARDVTVAGIFDAEDRPADRAVNGRPASVEFDPTIAEISADAILAAVYRSHRTGR